jgi:hypothetical protein
MNRLQELERSETEEQTQRCVDPLYLAPLPRILPAFWTLRSTAIRLGTLGVDPYGTPSGQELAADSLNAYFRASPDYSRRSMSEAS